MKKIIKTTEESAPKSKVGLAVAGIAATALASAGAFYFYGSKNAKKHRAETLEWMKKAEKEIMVRAKKMKKDAMNSAEYKKIVAEVSKKYESLKNVDAKDVQDFALTLTKAWKDIQAKL